MFDVAGRAFNHRYCPEFLSAIRSHFHCTHPQATYHTLRIGHITIVPTAGRIPRHLVSTANCCHAGSLIGSRFTFIIDVLLVPSSFNMQTCFNLYLDPDYKGPQTWYMSTRSLRDDVILLQRITVQGEYAACAAEQCDIPEDVRSRTDYRLVVTCPVLHSVWAIDCLSLFLVIEWDF